MSKTTQKRQTTQGQVVKTGATDAGNPFSSSVHLSRMKKRVLASALLFSVMSTIYFAFL